MSTATVGAAAMGLAGTVQAATGATTATPAARRPILMKAGHQHDHSEMTLRALAAFGVNNICSGNLGRDVEKSWSVEALGRLRKHVESFGLKLDCVPLPMASSPIARAEMPEILLAKDPARDRAIEDICTMIRRAGQAGIPMVKYNLTFIGVVRTERTTGRGGVSLSTFDYASGKQEPPLTEAGRITELGPAGIWWAAVDKGQWPEDPEERASIKADWQNPWGDRRQELVFIGRDMDRAGIEAGLREALLTDAEVALGMRKWRKLPDPFDAWEMGEAEAEGA